ncbi:MAG TPA: NAD-dependent epimerase/dehydratase family protein [bacterium]|nr:NAD-dependent epimerase/dehydratase family protein [bacterium]
MAEKHVLLGAGGSISKCLNQELLARHKKVKWVSRRGVGQDGVEALSADLLDAGAVLDAVEPSSIVYLLAGLKYKVSVWQEQWPKIMANVLAACEAKNARLVFFDNVYMYGKVRGPMTESSPVQPCSRKGEVRAAIAESLLAATRAGRVKALIARSADFYGPYADATSALNMMLLSRFAKGQSGIWVGDRGAKHAFTYTADCGKALALLALDESAYGQVWHLPTAPAISGREFIDLAARLAGVKASSFAMTRWMFHAAGLFDSNISELVEMFYQFDSDYEFDSSKFTEHFKGSPLPSSYEQGIRGTLEQLRKAKG